MRHTFERRMEKERASSGQQVSYICHNEDVVVPILDATVYPLRSQIHEQQIGKCIHEFGRVYSRIIVLYTSNELAAQTVGEYQ